MKEAHLTIVPSRQEGVLTLVLEGRLDTSNAPDLEQAIRQQLNGLRQLVIDIKDLDYLTSAGLRVLLSARKALGREGKLTILHANAEVWEVFEVTGFLDLLDVRRDSPSQDEHGGPGAESPADAGEEDDFLMEKVLQRRNPPLFRLYQDNVCAAVNLLRKYTRIFPDYTDHSELHSLHVIDFCNRLIGRERIARMNDDEIYCLLLACYLHDTGMGVSEQDYPAFLRQIVSAGLASGPVTDDEREMVRRLHQEFSACLIRKYAPLFEFPSPDHLFAIVQIARGHRKTDLEDPAEYPAALPLPNGNTVCLPYLAALIRLADEIDAAADRNSTLLYDLSGYTDERQIQVFSYHEAIRSLRVEPDRFVLHVQTEENWVWDVVREVVDKMRDTLYYCREVTARRT